MSAEQENFDKLKQLLALKKHEVPPPGYFDHLAGDIRARLRAGEHKQEDLWAAMGEEASWLQRLWSTLAAKPALATASGVAVCGIALLGIYFAQPNEQASLAIKPPEPFNTLAGSPISSTNAAPILNGPTLFDKIDNNPVSPVNFNPASH